VGFGWIPALILGALVGIIWPICTIGRGPARRFGVAGAHSGRGGFHHAARLSHPG